MIADLFLRDSRNRNTGLDQEIRQLLNERKQHEEEIYQNNQQFKLDVATLLPAKREIYKYTLESLLNQQKILQNN
jgi:ATP-dependent Zn protease